MNKAHSKVFVDAADKYHWRLIHDNGNILADSGEGYASKQKAKQSVGNVKRDASDADVVEA